MQPKKLLKIVHQAGILWFVISVGFIFVITLRQAGMNWWLIFSLSGYSAVLGFLLISIYLLAIFRGVVRREEPAEHPLTATPYYMVLYNISPFLGSLGGVLGTVDMPSAMERTTTVAIGTLAATFAMWVVVDPLAGMIEGIIPAYREHKCRRLAVEKALKEQQQKASQQLLEEILEREELNRRHWQEVLEPLAMRLCRLQKEYQAGKDNTENEVVEIGAKAWQLGGISCMKELHEMAASRIASEPAIPTADYTAYWWDGIGIWQKPASIAGMYAS